RALSHVDTRGRPGPERPWIPGVGRCARPQDGADRMAVVAPSVPSSLSLGRHGMTTTAQANRGANGRGGFRPPPRLALCAAPGLETEGLRVQERDRISLHAQEMAAD